MKVTGHCLRITLPFSIGEMRIILRSLISSLVLLGRVVQFLCVWSFRTLDCVLLEVPTMSCYVLSCPAM